MTPAAKPCHHQKEKKDIWEKLPHSVSPRAQQEQRTGIQVNSNVIEPKVSESSSIVSISFVILAHWHLQMSLPYLDAWKDFDLRLSLSSW